MGGSWCIRLVWAWPASLSNGHAQTRYRWWGFPGCTFPCIDFPDPQQVVEVEILRVRGMKSLHLGLGFLAVLCALLVVGCLAVAYSLVGECQCHHHEDSRSCSDPCQCHTHNFSVDFTKAAESL